MKLKELPVGSRFPLQDNIHTIIQLCKSLSDNTGLVFTVDKNFRMGSFDANYEPAWVDINYTSKVPEHGKVMPMIDYPSVHDVYVMAALTGLAGIPNCKAVETAFKLADKCMDEREKRRTQKTDGESPQIIAQP